MEDSQIIKGMKEIIEKHKHSLDLKKEEMEQMRNEINFCRKHKFDIEANEKFKIYNAISDVYYSFRNLLDDMTGYVDE